MGNYVYADRLLGMTIPDANTYVMQNIVYWGRIDSFVNGTWITKVEVRSRHAVGYGSAYNPSKLYVYVDDDNRISYLVGFDSSS